MRRSLLKIADTTSLDRPLVACARRQPEERARFTAKKQYSRRLRTLGARLDDGRDPLDSWAEHLATILRGAWRSEIDLMTAFGPAQSVTSVNQVDAVDHVLVTAGTGVPTSGLILG